MFCFGFRWLILAEMSLKHPDKKLGQELVEVNLFTTGEAVAVATRHPPLPPLPLDRQVALRCNVAGRTECSETAEV